jgi:sensor histidine kinase YesM
VYNNPEGEIFIQIKLIQDRLHFEISDNGIGIKNAEKSKVNKSSHNSIGSQVTQKRIELLSNLNQELSEVIISENNMSNKSTIYVGTRVSFSIPYYT